MDRWKELEKERINKSGIDRERESKEEIIPRWRASVFDRPCRLLGPDGKQRAS